MERIEKAAFYSVQSCLTLSQTDEDVLARLYLPIVKSGAYALYRRLLSQSVNLSLESYSYFDDLKSDLGLESFDLLQAVKKLEAIGLLRCFRREENNLVLYLFRPIPPATPKKFFSDVVLSHMLLQTVGSKRYQQLRFHFRSDEDMPLGYQDVTTSFTSVYNLEETSDDGEGSLDFEEKSYRSVSTFDYEKLLSLLPSECRKLSPDERKEITELAILYGLNESSAADLIEKNVDTASNFYIEGFRKDVRLYHRFGVQSNSASIGEQSGNRLAQIMESLSPAEYLSYRIGAKPAPFMLDLVERLYREVGLSTGLINTAIDYSLKKTDGKFVDSYIEKVAYTLKEQNIQSSYQAMVYLKDQDYQKRNVSKRKNNSTTKKKTEETTSVDEKELAELEKEFGL